MGGWISAVGQGSVRSAEGPTTISTGIQCLTDVLTNDPKSGSPANDQDTGSRRSPGRLRMGTPPWSAPYSQSANNACASSSSRAARRVVDRAARRSFQAFASAGTRLLPVVAWTTAGRLTASAP
jgi:hypothetical protein